MFTKKKGRDVDPDIPWWVMFGHQCAAHQYSNNYLHRIIVTSTDRSIVAWNARCCGEGATERNNKDSLSVGSLSPPDKVISFPNRKYEWERGRGLTSVLETEWKIPTKWHQGWGMEKHPLPKLVETGSQLILNDMTSCAAWWISAMNILRLSSILFSTLRLRKWFFY